MRRRTICICLFVLYLLAVCLILSEKIQEEMTTELYIQPVILNEKSSGYFTLPFDCVFQQGEKFLFLELTEGSGWTPGMRITAVEGEAYNIDLVGASISLIPVHDRQIIRHASRFPVIGQRGVAVEQEIISDEYLMVYPNAMPEYECHWDGVELVAEAGNARLLSLEKAESPFLRDQAGEKLYQIGGELCQIHSLHEAAQFLGNLPYLAVAVGILWAMLMFGVRLVLLVRDLPANLRKAATDAAILLLAMVFLVLLLKQIDLPASMLPAENIFDVRHYIREFRQIFLSLKEIGCTEHSLFPLRKAAELRALLLLLIGAVLPVLPFFRRKKEVPTENTPGQK